MDRMNVPPILLRSLREEPTGGLGRNTNLFITLISLSSVAFLCLVICILAYCLRGKKIFGRDESDVQWYFQGPTKEMGPFSSERMCKHFIKNLVSPTTMVRFNSEAYAPLYTFFPDGSWFKKTPVLTKRRGSAYSDAASRTSAHPGGPVPVADMGPVRSTLPETAFSPNYSLRPPRPPPCACPGPWFYKTPTGKVHGPFPANLMRDWFLGNKFPGNLPISFRKHGGPFSSLADVFAREPFASNPNLAAPALPPIPQVYSANVLQPPARNTKCVGMPERYSNNEDWHYHDYSERNRDLESRRNLEPWQEQRDMGRRPDQSPRGGSTNYMRSQSVLRSRTGATEPVVRNNQKEFGRAQSAMRSRPGSTQREIGFTKPKSLELGRVLSGPSLPDTRSGANWESAGRPAFSDRNSGIPHSGPGSRDIAGRPTFDNRSQPHSGPGSRGDSFLEVPDNGTWGRASGKESSDRNWGRGNDGYGRIDNLRQDKEGPIRSKHDSSSSGSDSSLLSRDCKRGNGGRGEHYRSKERDSSRENVGARDRLGELRVHNAIVREPAVSTTQTAVLLRGTANWEPWSEDSDKSVSRKSDHVETLNAFLASGNAESCDEDGSPGEEWSTSSYRVGNWRESSSQREREYPPRRKKPRRVREQRQYYYPRDQ